MLAALPLLLIGSGYIPTCPADGNEVAIVMPPATVSAVPINASIWFRGVSSLMPVVRNKSTQEAVEVERSRTKLEAASYLIELRPRALLEPNTDYEIIVGNSVREVIRTSTSSDTHPPAAPTVVSVKGVERLGHRPRPRCEDIVVVDIATSSDTVLYLYESDAALLEIGANVGFLNPNSKFVVTGTAAITVVAVDLTGQRSRPVLLPARSGTVTEAIPGGSSSDDDYGCMCMGTAPRSTGWTFLFITSIVLMAGRRTMRSRGPP